VVANATGQIVEQSDTSAAKVTMCELYLNPQQYAGKMVQFRASVMGRDLKHLRLEDFSQPKGCDAYMRIVALFPNDVSPRPSFEFAQDDSFDSFSLRDTVNAR
jgi:hypothetical protein